MENPTIDPEKDAYVRALDRFKVAKRALNECDLRIEVARMTKDTEALRRGLSERNKFVDAVELARDGVSGATVDLVRARGMSGEQDQDRANEGLLHKAAAMITKIMK